MPNLTKMHWFYPIFNPSTQWK